MVCIATRLSTDVHPKVISISHIMLYATRPLMGSRLTSFPGLDSFAKSPENAFSIVVATILVNVLSNNLELNFSLLWFTLGFYLIYIIVLLAYLPKACNLGVRDQHRFNRHVFHAGLWIGIFFSIIWATFVPYPQPAYGELPVAEWATIIQAKKLLPMFFAAPLCHFYSARF